MKKIKITIYSLALASMIFGTGCKKFLDEKPMSQLVEDTYFKDGTEVETGLMAGYDGLQKVYDLEYRFGEFRADNGTPVMFEGDWAAIKDFSESSSNAFVLEHWQNCYYTIARANLVLKYLDKVEDQAKRNKIEGEARFMRALMHFNLVRLFGDVPLIDHFINYDESDMFVRKPVATVYESIITDLLVAAKSCPDSWGSTEVARATSGAAKTILAKVYMTRGNWAEARTQLEAVIASAKYQLLPDYKDVISLSNEMNKEIIFAVRFKANSNGEGNTFSYGYNKNGLVRGIKGLANYQSLFEANDSTRFLAMLQSAADPFVIKYEDATAANSDAGNDVVVTRYADVLLMYAEALNELYGPSEETLAPLNAVRKRASDELEQFTVGATPVDTKEKLRKVIEKERRTELGFENHRWYDLLRYGTAIEQMNAYFTAIGRNRTVVPTHLLLPIPQHEIDLSSGKLTQNPGY